MHDENISIIIPAYNEEKRMGSTLFKIVNYFQKKPFRYEIIIVDDGSRDKTVEVIEKICNKNGFLNVSILKNNSNRGKGYSVKRGMEQARFDYVFFSDADLSTPIEEIERLMPWLKKDYEVAIGSRALRESRILVHQPLYREWMGKFFNMLVQLIAVRGIWDTQCGFKGFTKDAANKIFKKQTINGFGFDVEVIYIARKLNYKIKEVPVSWLNSPETKVHPVEDSLTMLFDLFKIRLNDFRSLYSG